MLQYIVILLDDTSVSFCHYPVSKSKSKLIPIDTLKQGIRYAMVENLTIQFAYPDFDLPTEYHDVIESIDHSNIKPMAALDNDTDIVVLDGWSYDASKLKDAVVVLRTGWKQLNENHSMLKDLLAVVQRLNVVITDVERMTDSDREQYKAVLDSLGKEVEQLYVDGKSPQLNLLTDRMMLTEMNNCNAGDSTITLAPDGNFYICPAFYQEGLGNVGNLQSGVKIPNSQLYKIKYAPICSHCDAFQCKRCIWLNKKMTLEVNTPSREQCVMAHYERNASRNLLQKVRNYGDFLPGKEIREIDYVDPFDVVSQKS